MTSLRSRRALPGIAAAFIMALAAAPLAAQTTTVTASDPWVREVPAGRATTGMFVLLKNAGPTERRVLSGKADVGDTLELHEMKRDNGMMRMSPVPAIVVPANGEVDLRPGGFHLMLFGLKKPLAVGDTVRATLTLDDGSEVRLVAPVRAMRMP
ncbi:MAG: copper chaperone PCu(A)C [Gemmatimonadetes bacterium]|nr:copper chaperone PCu(A)C [Gemmatimonadota bacterium]